MKLWATLASTLLALSLSFSAQAAFVYTDWKAVGDKGAVLDTDSGIEWLRLNHVNKKSMAQVLSQLDTIYAGWRLPTNAEVSTMMSRMYNGIQMNINSYEGRTGGYRTGANNFINLLSNGYKTTAHHVGIYYDEDNVLRLTGAYANEGGAYTITYGLEHTSALSGTSVLSYYRSGVFLVSDGGTTLSSINNPNLNLNNPNAPVNNPDAPGSEPTDVSVSPAVSFGMLGAMLTMAGRLKRKRTI